MDILLQRCQVLKNWVNAMLDKDTPKLAQFSDLKTGVALHRLLELISGRKSTNTMIIQAAMTREECQSNVRAAIAFANDVGIPLPPGISENDILDGVEERLFDVIWLFVRRYYLVTVAGGKVYNEANMSAHVMTSTSDRLAPLEVSVRDCGPSWVDGVALSALVTSYDTQLIAFAKLNRDDVMHNIDRAITLSAGSLGVPAIVTVDDIRRGDIYITMTYLAMFCHLAKNQQMRVADNIRDLKGMLRDRDLKEAQLQQELASSTQRIEELHKARNDMQKSMVSMKDEAARLQQMLQKIEEERDSLGEVVRDRDDAMRRAEQEKRSTIENAQNIVKEINRQKNDVATSLDSAVKQNLAVSKQIEGLLKAMSFAQQDRRPTENGIAPPTGWVTLLFTDVENSTKQWELDADIMATALTIHNNTLRRVMAEYRGYEVKTEGDAFMIAFDDSARAVACACAMQEELLANQQWPEPLIRSEPGWSPVVPKPEGGYIFRGLRTRMGLHTGAPQCVPDPVTGRMDYFGPVVNRAARIESVANGGQICTSDVVWNDIKDRLSEAGTIVQKELGFCMFKGLTNEILIYQVLPQSLAARSFPPLEDKHTNNVLTDQVELLKAQNRQLLEQLRDMEISHVLASTASALYDGLNSLRRRFRTADMSDTFKAIHQLLENHRSTKSAIQAEMERKEQYERELKEITDLANAQAAQIQKLSASVREEPANHVAAFLDKARVDAEWKAKADELRSANKELRRQNTSLQNELKEKQRALSLTAQKSDLMRGNSGGDLPPIQRSVTSLDPSPASSRNNSALGTTLSSAVGKMANNRRNSLSDMNAVSPASTSPGSDATPKPLGRRTSTDATASSAMEPRGLRRGHSDVEDNSPKNNQRRISAEYARRLGAARNSSDVSEGSTVVSGATTTTNSRGTSGEEGKRVRAPSVTDNHKSDNHAPPKKSFSRALSEEQMPNMPAVGKQPIPSQEKYIKDMLQLTIGSFDFTGDRILELNRFTHPETASHWGELVSQLKAILGTILNLFEAQYFVSGVKALLAALKSDYIDMFTPTETEYIRAILKAEAKPMIPREPDVTASPTLLQINEFPSEPGSSNRSRGPSDNNSPMLPRSRDRSEATSPQ